MSSIWDQGQVSTCAMQFVRRHSSVEGRQDVYFTGTWKSPRPQDIPNPTMETRKDVLLCDIRGLEDTARLDTDGFEYLRHPATHSLSPDEIEPTVEYITGVVNLVKRKLDAELVVCYDYRYRRNLPRDHDEYVYGVDGRSNFDSPVSDTHIDHTTSSGGDVVSRHLSPEEAERFLVDKERWRARIINVWRPINHPVKDNALALCHPSSLDEDDLAVVQYHPSSEHVGSMYKLHYSEKQKWLWLSCQQPDETVLFLQYDSRPGIGPKYCAHTAIAVHREAAPARPRESLEVRLIVITDEAAVPKVEPC